MDPRPRENLCLVGPAGTGKPHLLIGVGHAVVQAGLRVRYFTASDLVETLYRGLADNSVSRVIDNVLRVDRHGDRRRSDPQVSHRAGRPPKEPQIHWTRG
jgi:KaiC/GvpD/RAD55 family RecA-like ATPase